MSAIIAPAIPPTDDPRSVLLAATAGAPVGGRLLSREEADDRSVDLDGDGVLIVRVVVLGDQLGVNREIDAVLGPTSGDLLQLALVMRLAYDVEPDPSTPGGCPRDRRCAFCGDLTLEFGDTESESGSYDETHDDEENRLAD